MSPFPHLFAPGKIGPLDIPNRIVFAATSSELADVDGFVSDDMVEYYAERARGGAGLIIVEATYVEQEGKRLHHNAMLHHDDYVAGMRKIVDATHLAGAKAALQLNHGGRESIAEVSGAVPVAPSALPSHFTGVGEAAVPREVTVPEIRRIIASFAEAAWRARVAGYDAVELHGAHGYLIGQFLSPDSNKRQDDYGGDLPRRARFGIELIRAIKSRAGRDFPLIFRLNGRDHISGGLELDQALEIAELLEMAGADAISVSGGVHASRPYMVVPGMSVERGCYAAYAAAVRQRVRVPVMTVGRINTPKLAEEILVASQADFICLSRALIADPFFPAKAAAGEVETIAPCIACNECIATVHRHKGLACTVNPMVSRELELKPLLARKAVSQRVIVLGSGAAGMSAAVTAARRGHQVLLFENEPELGGQLNLAHQPPHRGEIENVLRYFKSELVRLGVTVRLHSALTLPVARELKPDAIIVATGAAPRKAEVPGGDLPHVLMGWRVLAGLEHTGQRCAIVGGGLVGVEVADYLADRGKAIVLLARTSLLKKAVHADRVYFEDRIAALQIEVLVNTSIVAIGMNDITITSADHSYRTLFGIDNVIFCTGYRPRKDQNVELEQLGVPLKYVGDVMGSRKFFQAIEEGTLAALNL